MTDVELLGLAPAITLTVVGCLALLLEVAGIPVGARRLGKRTHVAFVTAVGMVVAAAFALSNESGLPKQGTPLFGGQLTMDRLGALITLMACVAGIIGLCVAVHYLRSRDLERGEVYALLSFSVAGMSLMGMSTDLIVMFIALEVLSVGVYCLSGLDRESSRSTEAAIKYFINGAFASGVFLFGAALVYGVTGSLSIHAMGQAAVRETGINGTVAVMGLSLVLVGLGFKAALVPFHIWVPDVYDGAPAPITAFMSAGVKAAAFAALIRVVATLVPNNAQAPDLYVEVAWFVAVATMTLGNVAALAQRRIKRMLAYSSISHAGYVMVGVVALLTGRSQALGPVVYYLLAYTFMGLGSFGVVALLERKEGRGNTFEEWSGAARRYPAAGLAMGVFMFGLAGIPPTAGFMGKFALFQEAVRAGLVPLTIIAVLNSLVSVYYYLRVLVFMYMKEPDRELQATSGPWLVVGVAAAALVVLIMGVTPSAYLEMANGVVGLTVR